MKIELPMRNHSTPPRLTDLRSTVVVIGGGVAGAWVAYQLAKAGIQTTLIAYDGIDRGGLQGASRKSAGAMNTSPLASRGRDFQLEKLGHGQTHPSVERTLHLYLSKALGELSDLVDLKPVKIGFALRAGNGEALLRILCHAFRERGGQVVDGWVTRLLADATACRGVQYEAAAGIGKIHCRAIVIATGGYSGLLANAIRTNCFGNVLGSYLQAGGIATNLEFFFKHGYGNIDAHAVTPTEELPGAEIYNDHQERVRWLEALLFERQGTNTHLQAVQLWLQNPSKQFYIDLSYRSLYLELAQWHAQRARDASAGMDQVLELFPAESRPLAKGLILEAVRERHGVEYQTFERLKALCPKGGGKRFRVRPLTYFSMGGVGHVDFRTNLHAVYVAGEAMHDFGANRVGGLPWSLYLASAYLIVERLSSEVAASGEYQENFELIAKHAHFDARLLEEIQVRLYEAQERNLTAAHAEEFLRWVRRKRAELEASSEFLHDGVSWLLVAEAIMQASLCRTESRGFFFRLDFQQENQALDHSYSCAWYDQASGQISARLLTWEELAARFPGDRDKHGQELSYDGIVQRC
ncbi:MAG TPA: FAD-dependent oxidoreductase [Chthoniobacterales bacterium]